MSRLVRPFTLLVFLLALVFSDSAFAAPRLRLWHAYRGDEEKALQQILEGFKDAELEVLSVPSDAFDSKLASAALVGEGPDVLIAEHHHLGDYRARNIVAPANAAFEGDASFIEPAVRSLRDGNDVWGIPLSPKCVALFVNDALVQKTPADLEGIAELKATLPPGVFPLVYEAKNPYAHAPIFGAFGGVLLTKEDQFGFAGANAEASLALARSFIVSGAVPEDADYNILKELFKAGKVAFVISGPWFAGELSNAPGLKYHVEVLPKIRAAGQPMRPLLTVESAIVSKTGALKPESFALAKWLGSSTAATIRARVARMLTARTDVEMPADDPMLRAFAEQAKETIPMPSSRAMQAVWNPAERAIAKVLRGDAPPDVALAEAKRRFDNVRRPLPPETSAGPYLVTLGIGLLLLVFVWLARARKGDFKVEVKRSLPAYAYIAHSIVVISVLVIAPLFIGALTSFFTGNLLGSEERRFVGFANFIEILTAQGGSLLTAGSFYVVLLVTLLWTFTNLFFHVTIGIALGLLLSKPMLRFKAMYRVLLIIPWAVPSYITALVWKGMFHRQFGALTGLINALNDLFGTSLQPISMFAKFSTAFAANLSTNVWLGFPFMMVVTLGALTAVPQDVLEAADVDGATRWQRLWRVTLPMIRPTLAPSVTLGGIWTFNMFNVVNLVSGGQPDGTTNILVTEAYEWAFTREAKYGYAAAYSVLIFFMLFGFTRWDEWRTARKVARELSPPNVKEAKA